MKKAIWSLGAIALAICNLHGQAYVHQKLGSGFSNLSTGILTSLGYPAWSGELASSPGDVDVFLITGNNNVSASVLGTGRDASPADQDPIY